MTAITVHPKTQQQAQAFEQIAKALKVAYEITPTNNEKPTESAFMQEFNAGIDIETARKKSIQFVNKLWKK